MLATCPDEADLLALANGEPGDDATRAHIESCDICRRQMAELQNSLHELREAAQSMDPVQTQMLELDEPPPEQIGKYRVLSTLDRGGQAWVLRVLHPTIQKEMVLKLSRFPMAPDQMESGRMMTEARVLAELDHPAIARVYDLDVCRQSPFEGHPFIVMEWVPGRTLLQFCSDHPVGAREAALLIAKVARAAAAAHARGITHRDISLRNILIDEKGEPRLIDFGLARIGSAWSDTRDPAGTIAGTPAFMAPEQSHARLEEIGPRTDVYALGAVLASILRPRSEPGSATDVALNNPIPKTLQSIIDKATQAKPADRYDSANLLADELESFARPPSRKWFAISLAVTGVAAVLAMAILLRPAPPIPPLADVLHVRDREPLSSFLPLTSSVPVFFSAEVPRGTVPVAIWIDPDGSVELAHPPLAQAAADDPNFDRWECWRNTRTNINPKDPGGTKFVLICARKKAMNETQIAALMNDLKQFVHQGWLGDLPPRQLIRVGSVDHGVQAEISRGFESRSAEGSAAIQRLNELRRHLLDAGYTFFEGEAFPYVRQ